MAEHAQNEGPQKRELSAGKKLLFRGVIFVVMAALLELVATGYLIALRGYDGEHLYQYEFDAYKNLLPARNFVDTRGIRHNAQGFRRSVDVKREKASNTYRIFLMGGSTAYGLGGLWTHIDPNHEVLDNTETIDAYLEKKLNAATSGMQVEVINAAITSTWTHHHLIYLNQTILGYDPDMVIFLDGYNDFFRFRRDHDQFASYGATLPAQSILGEPTLGALAYANGWWFFRTSAFGHLMSRGMRTVQYLFKSKPEQLPIDVDQTLERMQTIFTRNALKMQRRSGLILQDEDIETVFTLQPMLMLDRARPGLTEVERKLLDYDVEARRPNYEQFFHRAADFVRKKEVEMAADVGARFIDLTSIYVEEDEQVYTDYTHLTPHGNEILAGVVAEAILPTLRNSRVRARSGDVAAAGR